jgi:hypothetical protein
MATREVSVEELIRPPNIRKLIQKTVDTYPLEWKVVQEAVQNAKDAIQKGGKPGSVEITLDVGQQSVTVSDNGCGFPPELDLLGIGGTDKDDPYEPFISGNQGVGIKAVIFSSKSFKLDSVRDGRRWQAWIEGANRYLAGEAPVLKITDPVESPDAPGTRVEYSFPDPWVTEFVNDVVRRHVPMVREHLCKDMLDRVKMAFEFHFRSFSYAGDVQRLLGRDGIVPVAFRLALVATGGVPPSLDATLKQLLEEEGTVEVRFANKHWDFQEAVQRTRERVPRPTVLDIELPEGGKIGAYNQRYAYVAKLTTRQQYEALLRNPNLRKPVDPASYAPLFEQLDGIYLVIGARPTLFDYLLGPPRQFISASGIPTSHVLSGPTRGGEASYVTNNIHFVADVRSRLNYGKQTIPNPWLVGMVSRFFDDAVRATLRNVATAIVGHQLGSTSADDIEAGVALETNILGREDLAEGKLAFKKIPCDENALIAIFSELMGRGVLSGYHLYSLSGKARYDGRGTMRIATHGDMPEPRSDADLCNIEFKLQLRELIDDFEEEVKFPNEVSLIIVWDDQLPSSITDYEVVDIEHTPDADRAMDGVDKCLICKRAGRFIQMLVIKDVVRHALAAS